MEWIAITLVCLAATFFGSGSSVSVNLSLYNRGGTVSSQAASEDALTETDALQDTRGGGAASIPLSQWPSWNKWDDATKDLMREWAAKNGVPEE